MAKTVKEMIQKRALSEYPISKKLGWIYVCFYCVVIMACVFCMSKSTAASAAWVVLGIAVFSSLLGTMYAKEIERKYLCFSAYLILLVIIQIGICVICALNPTIIFGVYAGASIGFAIRGLTRGCFRVVETSRWTRKNDLYYEKEVHNSFDRDAKHYRSVRTHMLEIITKMLFLTLYGYIVVEFGVIGAKAYLFLLFPIQESIYRHIPISLFKILIIRNGKKETV